MKKIELTKGYEAIVDDEDFERVNQYKWHAFERRDKKVVYAARTDHTPEGDKTIRLHRFIMNAPKDMQVDHVSGNGLDNRRVNLRNCTNSDNQKNREKNKNNTTGYKGVTLNKRLRKFIPQITVNGENLYLGCYMTAKEAALAYNIAAKKYFGKFARLNKP